MHNIEHNISVKKKKDTWSLAGHHLWHWLHRIKYKSIRPI